MAKSIKNSNLLLGFLLVTGLAGTTYEAYQCWEINKVNLSILADQQISDSDYPHQQKFASAYDQGEKKDYKHAVQTYGQLLETNLEISEQAKIQFNIANNLFVLGLIRRVNDDGSLQDEARYAYTQARMAYEQSLRLAPTLNAARFNLSLVHSMLSQNTKIALKEQSTMELSNLPIGLP